MSPAKVEIGRWDESDPTGQGPPELQALEMLAWVLDSSIPVPGTRLRIGLDGLLGFLPVVGDLIGSLLSAFILIQAARMGVPRVTLLRMGFNVALLRKHLENPSRARRGDWVFAGLLIVGVVALAVALGWGAYALLAAIFARAA